MPFPLKRRLYESMPTRVKSLVRLLPFGFWAGKAYRRVLRRGAWFDRAEAGQIRAWQSRALGKLLQFAVREVPAYRSLRSVVERLEPFEALRAFPIIDKNDLQAEMPRYLPACLDRIPHYRITTGGTSGNQLTLYVDDDYQATEMGFMHRQWARVGYGPGKRKATFRGVSFPSLPEGVYWQKNPIYNELQFSPFHMSPGTMGRYVQAMVEFAPEFLHGYPSAISLLADYILRNRLEGQVRTVRAALLASEGATQAQRESIEKAFSCRAFSWYGHSERALLAGECEHSSQYHCLPDYGYAELIDPEGNAIRADRDDQVGELTVTGFQNFSMPLIRYRTGDGARFAPGPCRCERQWQRICDVQGHRNQEMLIGAGGEKVSLAALNMHGPLFANVVRYQYHQSRPGQMQIRLMVTPEFTQKDRSRIQEAYAGKVGRGFDVRAVVVPDIPLTARGKLRRLDSQLTASGSLADELRQAS
jgi:phenylacetate-CoA ligase